MIVNNTVLTVHFFTLLPYYKSEKNFFQYIFKNFSNIYGLKRENIVKYIIRDNITERKDKEMVLKTSSALGKVFISNAVIAEIAGAVAGKCYGVVGMASRNKKDGIVNLLMPDSMTKGINVTVEDSGIMVDMHIIVEYGININTICKSIVNRVRYTLESSVGLKVNKINVKVEGIRVDE